MTTDKFGALVSVVQGVSPWPDKDDAANVFTGDLFGAPGGRYPDQATKSVKLRAPQMSEDSVRYAAYIHPSNQDSGPYGGMSIAIFPSTEAGKPCLLTFVVGTAGLDPDDAVLGRPGHARKVQALVAWLNAAHGSGDRVAWAKHDPVRTDLRVPTEVVAAFPNHRPVFDRYGSELYAVYEPRGEPGKTQEALSAFLDLMLAERGFETLATHKSDAKRIEDAWFGHLMPNVIASEVAALMTSRKYVVIQGPPGTGKTRMALELLRETYVGNGTVIQFHPNTTYENFVGGLAPQTSDAGVGFQFAPHQGALMEAAAKAQADPTRPYLLVIDELNRADLGKVLGEAIYLFEAGEAGREIDLPYDFGAPFGSKLRLPQNLHVLGTMNSTDRSLAIVDVAVRRRFSFVKLWPHSAVVDEQGNDTMSTAFHDLLDIFVEHASGETFDLVPGHSYFLLNDNADPKRRLQVTLVPLLDEYLLQGYVSGFAEDIRAYIQWIDSLP